MPRCTSICPTTGTHETEPPRCARMAGHDGDHQTAGHRLISRDGCLATVEPLPVTSWPEWPEPADGGEVPVCCCTEAAGLAHYCADPVCVAAAEADHG